MKKFLLLLGISCVFALSMQAQKSLHGTIVDDSGQQLALVTVRILTPDSVYINGAVTDDNGVYSFKGIKPDTYILVASNVGYVSRYINFTMPTSDYTLPLITLKTDNIVLEGIEIKGNSFIKKKDHLLVIPDKQQLKHAYTGYDLLYNLMIPGVDVNRRDGIVSTPHGSATLYINGVQASFREIQNLRSKDIEKVEYFDLPTGNYLGDMASINYVTKEYKTGGYISLDAEQNIGYMAGKYDIGAKLTDGKTDYTFFGGYNMKKYDGIEKRKNEEIVFPEYSVKRNTTNNNANLCSNQQYAQLKVNNKTKKRNLSGTVSLIREATPHNDADEFLVYSGYGNQNIQSVEKIYQRSMKPAIGLDGIFTPTENQRIRIMLNGSYTQNEYERNYKEEESLFTRADEDLYSFSVIGTYNIRLKHKNSFGGNVQHYHNITSSSYRGDYDSWQHLWMGETILFLNYSQDLGDKFTFNLSPGGSLLNYKLHGNGFQRFWTFRTNSWVCYNFNLKHRVAVGFSIGNNQAKLSYLNATDQTVDFLQLKRGNPNLDNPKIYDIFMNYGGQIGRVNLQLDATYTSYTHNISPDYYIEKDKLVSSYYSNTSYHRLKTDLFVSAKISDNLRTNLKMRYEYMDVPESEDLSQNNMYASLDVNYFLKSFTVNIYAKTTERILDSSTYSFMKYPASYGLSVRYNGKNWMVEAGTENPFTRQVHYKECADYGVYRYSQVRTSRIYQQTGYVKLAYTFDFGKKISRENNYIDRSINSAILKAK